jgi:uncharacterized protein YwqG
MISSDVSALVDGIVDYTLEIESTHHAGRHNRLYARRKQLIETLTNHEASESGYLALLNHENAKVRLSTAWDCRYKNILTERVTSTLNALAALPGEIGDSARNCLQKEDFKTTSPPPSKTILYDAQPEGCTRTQAVSIIGVAFSDAWLQSILDLLRPSIRLWPKPVSQNPIASRFGGMPVVPTRWAWPVENDEPLLFLAQINCAEVKAYAGSEALPSAGLLAFFGDGDDVNGCGPTGGGRVYYFPDISHLNVAEKPLYDFEPQISCGLSFYNSFELPDPKNKLVTALNLSAEERDAYCDVSGKIAKFGLPSDWASVYNSKLFGWPKLVQGELDIIKYYQRIGMHPILLIQIGWYHDGAEWEGWGPGGLVYFVIDETALTEGRFEAAELDMQCT